MKEKRKTGKKQQNDSITRRDAKRKQKNCELNKGRWKRRDIKESRKKRSTEPKKKIIIIIIINQPIICGIEKYPQDNLV